MFEKRNDNEIIPICFDRLFKKVFGDPFAVHRLEAFLSVYYDIPYEKLKGKVTILESDRREAQKSKKQQDRDLIIKMEIDGSIKYINIEVNNEKGIIVVRNITYTAQIIAEYLKNKEDYDAIPPIIQINFNDFYINDSSKVVQRYFYRDEEGYLLSELSEIDHINLAMSENRWYNGSIKKEKKEDQGPIQLGALLKIRKKDELLKCLEGINMPKEIKEDIYNTVVDYSSFEDNIGWYDKELDTWKINEGNKKLARREGYQEGMEKGMEKGMKESSIAIAKNLLKMKYSIEQVSKITDLSKEEIEKLR